MTLKESNFGFSVKYKQYIEEIKSEATVLEHIKSGVTLIHLKNTDPHKVFTISFKTLPTDNTGVAHIVEHSVCCASKNYPLKDTFMEMDKGSVNTCLNACTYKDMTMYYAASLNEQDLLNLMDVYMDLVFHPLIYDEPYLFKQEGWHYEIEDIKDPILYNGIVYNEMKGEYGEVGTRFEYEVHRALFPDTCYQFDSGGIPEDIVKLTEEDFLAFHKKNYRPSNACIYLYGDGDMEKQLKLLDEKYLQFFTKDNLDEQPITLQTPLEEPVKVKKSYPIAEEESEEEKTLLGMSFVVGEAKEGEMRLAFEILEHLLLKSAASPLEAALIEKNHLGKSLSESGYDPGKAQPTFSIVLNGCSSKSEEVFEEIVWEALRELVDKGIPSDLLEAAFNTVAFALYEGESQGEPKGVLYSEDIQMSLLYGGNAFEHLNYQKHLKAIEKKKDNRYFENLIEKYFLNNKHRVYTVLYPCKKLLKNQEKQETNKLKAYKKQLSSKELKELIEVNEELNRLQEETVAEELLDALPSLSLEDLQHEPIYLKYEEKKIEGVNTLWHDEKTLDILYVHLLFDTRGVSPEDIPYVGILAHLLTYTSTKHYTYDALENTINKETGGLNCSLNAYGHFEDTNSYKPIFKISAKVFLNKLPELIQLLLEITTQSLFDEKEKIKDLLQFAQHEYEKSFTSSPEYRATRRLYTYFSASGVYEDLVSGLGFYGVITELCNHFERDFEKLSNKLLQVYQTIMTKDNLLVSITGNKESKQYALNEIKTLYSGLPFSKKKKYVYHLGPTIDSEGFITASQVQAIAKGYNFKDYGHSFNGAMYVVGHLLDTTYLWDNIRLKGGAYGCDIVIGRDGNVAVCSYCDPNLTETIDVYNKIADYLTNLTLSPKELEKYIIGTMGSLDYPLTMEQKSESVVAKYLCGITDEMLMRERKEVLETTIDTVREIGSVFASFLQENKLCVIGNGKMIKKHKKLFNHVAAIENV